MGLSNLLLLLDFSGSEHPFLASHSLARHLQTLWQNFPKYPVGHGEVQFIPKVPNGQSISEYKDKQRNLKLAYVHISNQTT